jgi:hypothetical protein
MTIGLHGVYGFSIDLHILKSFGNWHQAGEQRALFLPWRHNVARARLPGVEQFSRGPPTSHGCGHIIYLIRAIV